MGTYRDTEQVSGQTEIQSKRGDRQRYIARVGTYRDTEQRRGKIKILRKGRDRYTDKDMGQKEALVMGGDRDTK